MNLKTPDEIKKGLECCKEDECFGEKENCPYTADPSLCVGMMCADTLALIQRLEAQNAEKAERIQQLEAERDALTKLVKEYRPCWECEYRSTGLNEPCLHCDKDNNCFEWRGVQKEAFDDPQATD